MKLTVSLLALTILSSSLRAQSWRYLGLSGHIIETIAVDPQNPAIIYAGSSGDFSSGVPGAVFKSTDSGTSWDTLLSNIATRQVVLHPTNSDTVYVVCGPSYFSSPGLLKSPDAGRSWEWSDSGIYYGPDRGLFCFAINPVNPSIMYAGTGGFFGGVFYKSTDAGRSWFWPEYELPGESILHIVLDPLQPDTLYVGVSSVWRSYDAGTQWDVTLLDPDLVEDLAIDPVNTNRLYALISFEKGGPFARTTDRGQTWTSRRVADSSARYGWSVVVNPKTPNDLFVAAGNAASAGVYRSHDHGETWTPFNEGFEGNWPQVLFVDATSNRLYLGATTQNEQGGGVFVRDLVVSVENRISQGISARLECYPNPFNTSVTILYSISTRQQITLDLTDIMGRETLHLVDGPQDPGDYETRIDGTRLASGVYFLRLRSDSRVSSSKIILLR